MNNQKYIEFIIFFIKKAHIFKNKKYVQKRKKIRTVLRAGNYK